MLCVLPLLEQARCRQVRQYNSRTKRVDQSCDEKSRYQPTSQLVALLGQEIEPCMRVE